MTTQGSSQKKPMNVVMIIKTPIRAISKVLDLYVKSVISFSNAYNRPVRYMVEVTPTSQRLPRSFTTGCLPDNNDPTPEGAFVRSISTGTVCSNKAANNVNITDLQLFMIQRHWQQVEQLSASRKALSRSCVVAMGKIDEERVSSFRNDSIALKCKPSGINIDEDDLVCSKKRSDDRMSTKRIKFM